MPPTWINERPTEGIVDQQELDGVLLNWGASAATAAVLPQSAFNDLAVESIGGGSIGSRQPGEQFADDRLHRPSKRPHDGLGAALHARSVHQTDAVFDQIGSFRRGALDGGLPGSKYGTPANSHLFRTDARQTFLPSDGDPRALDLILSGSRKQDTDRTAKPHDLFFDAFGDEFLPTEINGSSVFANVVAGPPPATH